MTTLPRHDALTPVDFATRFEILRPLAQGSAGEVSLARDQAEGDVCCIKALDAGADGLLEQRFLAECSVLVALECPFIVPVRAFGVDKEAGTLWYAMDRMAGSLYGRFRQHGPADPVQVARWMVQALAGLEVLHRRGVVHRDVKPANLLLDHDSNVKLADLGLARHPTGSVPFRTQHDRGIGTPEYAAPELFRDAATADPRADLYGIAACFYELTTGEAPARFVLHPVDPEILAPVEPAFVGVLQWLGASKPEHRAPDARAAAEVMARAADEVARARGDEPEGASWMSAFEEAAPPLGLSAWMSARLWHWGLR